MALIKRVNEAWDHLHQIFSEVLGEKEHDEIAIHISYMGDQLKESWGRFSCFRGKKIVPMIPSEKRKKTAK